VRTESFQTTLEQGNFPVCLLDYEQNGKTALDVILQEESLAENAAFIVLLDTDDHEINKKVLKNGAADTLVKQELSETLLEKSIRYALHRRDFQIEQARFQKERELLLKEVEHRVKNNLQIVAGLLSWESGETGSEQNRGALQTAQNRVQTMMLIHEKLYQASHSLDQIDFGAFAPELFELILKSHGLSPQNVSLTFDMPYSVMNLTNAVPCGLILTELLSNALAHGYDEDPQQISIGLHLRKYGSHLMMVFRDNGSGLNELPERGNNFGLKLIHLLVEQIHGQIRYLNKNGLAVHIRFAE
jgi:two-component sensor histidine kinase